MKKKRGLVTKIHYTIAKYGNDNGIGAEWFNILLSLPNVLQGVIIFSVFGLKKSVKSQVNKSFKRKSLSKSTNSSILPNGTGSHQGRSSRQAISMNPKNPINRSVSFASDAKSDSESDNDFKGTE